MLLHLIIYRLISRRVYNRAVCIRTLMWSVRPKLQLYFAAAHEILKGNLPLTQHYIYTWIAENDQHTILLVLSCSTIVLTPISWSLSPALEPHLTSASIRAPENVHNPYNTRIYIYTIYIKSARLANKRRKCSV